MAVAYCPDCGRVEVDRDEPCPECGAGTEWCEEPCAPDTECEHCEDYWDLMRAAGYWQDGHGWTAAAFREWAKYA